MPASPMHRSTLVSIAVFVSAAIVSLGSSSQFSESADAPPAAVSASVPASVPAAVPAAVPASSAPTPVGSAGGAAARTTEPYRLFPALLGAVPEQSSEGRVAYGPRPPISAEDAEALRRAAELAAAEAAERTPILAGNQVLAFYGKPGAPSMGILGEYTKEQLAPLLDGYARLYDSVNGDLGVVPAFYIIYGTCWPAGEIGKLKDSVVRSYIEFAAERGWLVFLDHQLGKYGVEESVRSMLPYLAYPNVHLAIDPEWRTLKPMQEIGSITGAELNEAQRIVDAYLRDNGLPGIRMLVVHQFKPTMIRDSASVTAGFDRVVLVHTADGFGSPALKRQTYASNARLANMPVKGFKLFFESKVEGAGWDKPLMRPEEVLALDPMPLVIMYQ
ncbi:MAG: hypothetical protein H7A27_03335 [Spirochaetaceae bacterium]|nr:hypothetical protein [Spirochaetaceae bacterium]